MLRSSILVALTEDSNYPNLAEELLPHIAGFYIPHTLILKEDNARIALGMQCEVLVTAVGDGTNTICAQVAYLDATDYICVNALYSPETLSGARKNAKHSRLIAIFTASPQKSNALISLQKYGFDGVLLPADANLFFGMVVPVALKYFVWFDSLDTAICGITPSEAIKRGAHRVIIGDAILKTPEPLQVIRQINESIKTRR